MHEPVYDPGDPPEDPAAEKEEALLDELYNIINIYDNNNESNSWDMSEKILEIIKRECKETSEYMDIAKVTLLGEMKCCDNCGETRVLLCNNCQMPEDI